MDIFIRRLPSSVTRLDIIHFVSEALRPRWDLLRLTEPVYVEGCEIFQVTDPEANTVEYHGLAHIPQAKQAQTLMERLNGATLKGKQMQVRKYYRRSMFRDRRKHDLGLPVDDSVEIRRTDRRRPHLQIRSLHAGATIEEEGQPLFET